MPPEASGLETLLRRDRALVLTALVLLSLLAWAAIAGMARDMKDPGMALAMPQMRAWEGSDLLALFAMWAVMMVAMMLPSAAPVVLIVAGMNRRRLAQGQPFTPTGLFVFGYLIVWTAFSAIAATAQLLLHNHALLSPAMESASPYLAGGLLIAAGVYQWTPLKRACLSHCRSPLHVLGAHWREGASGAVRMGIIHGTYCLGCCWLLMALLFVAGVMNLAWVAAIAAFVLVEKLVPRGVWLSWAVGVVLAGWGGALLISALR